MKKSQATEQNLFDAGCDTQTIASFWAFAETGDTAAQLRLLSAHRKSLLDAVHAEQKKLGCLDYLIFQIQKSTGCL